MNKSNKEHKRNRSYEEVHQEHLNTLGPDFGTYYSALYDECCNLHFKWNQYIELFGSSPERVKLLNQSAGRFFRLTQDIFIDDILLHLMRLTDYTKKQKKKQCLTIRLLPDYIEDNDFKSLIEDLVQNTITASGFARERRNKYIAHRDLNLAIDSTAKPLPPIFREHVSSALTALSNCLQKVHKFYFNSNISFDKIIVTDDAVSLLQVLEDGIRSREIERERRRARLISSKRL
jgi:hypothetical protein